MRYDTVSLILTVHRSNRTREVVLHSTVTMEASLLSCLWVPTKERSRDCIRANIPSPLAGASQQSCIATIVLFIFLLGKCSEL